MYRYTVLYTVYSTVQYTGSFALLAAFRKRVTQLVYSTFQMKDPAVYTMWTFIHISVSQSVTWMVQISLFAYDLTAKSEINITASTEIDEIDAISVLIYLLIDDSSPYSTKTRLNCIKCTHCVTETTKWKENDSLIV